MARFNNINIIALLWLYAIYLTSANPIGQILSYENEVVAVDPRTLPQIAGPFLKFVKATGNLWSGSVMIVSREYSPVNLYIRGPDNFQRSIVPRRIFVYYQYQFWRYDITDLPMRPLESIRYQYSLPNAFKPGDYWFDFYVASSEADPGWRWAFYSCNGFSTCVSEERRQQMGGLQPLWRDLMQQHRKQPFHCLVGGGDQLYADKIWHLPSLQPWLRLSGRNNREIAPWTEQMEEEAHQFYFTAYMQHFTGPIIRDAFASIPQVNMCDDHDFFDGLGSNAAYLERSKVFRELKRVAYLYYLLFQHQTTPKQQLDCTRNAPIPANTEYFGVERGSYSTLKQFGPEVALLSLDLRGERTPDQMLSKASWDEVWHRVESLPPTVRHLIIVTGVPVVYPALKVVEVVLNTVGVAKRFVNKGCNHMVSGLSSLVEYFAGEETACDLRQGYEQLKQRVGKNGMMRPILNQFGEPELNDDVRDHFTHPSRKAERLSLIHRLQSLASRRGNLRITLLSGDVHCCAVGKLCSSALCGDVSEKQDYRLMFQIVSSAIGNVPPPDSALTAVHLSASNPTKLDEYTDEEMLNTFVRDVDGTALSEMQSKFLGRRNYCLISPAGENLEVTLRVEGCGAGPNVEYQNLVPPLEMGNMNA